MNLPTIKEHATRHALLAKKNLGQNFLFDLSLTNKIASQAAITPEKEVIIEVGPGPGGLTRAILNKKPHKLIVIEKDQRCIKLLEEIKQYHHNLEIHCLDALKVPLKSLFNDNIKITIIANLPYNIGTTLIFKFLEEGIFVIKQMVFTLQKEVVDRICASPNNKLYGKLSVMIQSMCEVKKCFDISPKAFVPPPKVTSSIVKITPKDSLLPENIRTNLRKITDLAFNQRRKLFIKTLNNFTDNAEMILSKLQIDAQSRPENISVEDFVKIAQIITEEQQLNH